MTRTPSCPSVCTLNTCPFASPSAQVHPLACLCVWVLDDLQVSPSRLTCEPSCMPNHTQAHAHVPIHTQTHPQWVHLHACSCTYLHSIYPHLQPFPMVTATPSSASPDDVTTAIPNFSLVCHSSQNAQNMAILHKIELWLKLVRNIEKIIKTVRLMQPLKVPETWLVCHHLPSRSFY